jgi:hypothetical protein
MNQGVFASQQPVQYWRPRRQLFTANGIWVRPQGVRSAIVTVIGGSGGGASGCSGLILGVPAGCGTVIINELPASVSVTVGSGGDGGGGSGGTSSFGAFATATGGNGTTTRGSFSFSSPSVLMFQDVFVPTVSGRLMAFYGVFPTGTTNTTGFPGCVLVEWVESTQ